MNTVLKVVYLMFIHVLLGVSLYINSIGYPQLADCLESQQKQEQKFATRHAIDRYIQSNRPMDSGMSAGYSAMYISAGREFDLDPMLLAVVGKFESNFNPSVVSYTGAVGVQQIMPFWVKEIPFLNSLQDLYSPELNIRASAYILAHYRELCGESVLSMAACYHGGPNAIRNPKESTQKFKAVVSYAFYKMKGTTTYDSSI